jgi:hypothetical protein
VAFSAKDKNALEKGKPGFDKRDGDGVSRRIRPGVSDYLIGGGGRFSETLSPFLPQELVGGSIPHIAGTEDESVWNAASQACSTEKVHYVYSADGGRLWYLACPSSALAAAPDSWCPLAAALPGKSEHWDRETVYLFEQEGLASALRWDPDTGRMQVFLGASRTLLPRMQSMDANFVTINPEVAEIIPWKNRQLMTERLSRASALALLLVGIGVNILIFLFLIFQFILTNTTIGSLDDVKAGTVKASQELMVGAYDALQSDAIRHMVRIQQMLDELAKIDGTLVKYSVEGDKVEWEVLVPPAYGQGIGTIMGQVQPGLEKDGRVRIKGTQ